MPTEVLEIQSLKVEYPSLVKIVKPVQDVFAATPMPQVGTVGKFLKFDKNVVWALFDDFGKLWFMPNEVSLE